MSFFAIKLDFTGNGIGLTCLNFGAQSYVMRKANHYYLILAVFLLAGTFRAYAKDTPADILTNWMETHCKMVRNAKGISHVAYARNFSYTAIAVYESIVQSDRTYRSLSGQLKDLPNLPVAPKDLYWPASLNSAYGTMLAKYYGGFGNCQKKIDSLREHHRKNFVKQGVSKKAIELGESFGKTIAETIIKWSELDRADHSMAYVPAKGDGLWEPTPPTFSAAAVPHWSGIRRFSDNLDKAFVIQQPQYAKDSGSAFYRMAREVYDVTSNLTPEQSATALYWDDSPNGSYITVYGHWSSILSDLIAKHELSLLAASEAFARMTISMYDASILAWKGKYQFNVMRPITFIHQHINKNWAPLIATPPHPEFPAAHATLSYAAATALCASFGENCQVSDKTYADIGMKERKYSSLQEAAKEAGISRLYGGIHYRYSIEQGFLLGEKTARHIIENIIFQNDQLKKVKKHAR